jgi:hypothetical protein
MMTKKSPSVIQMGREELATLLTSVNETLATDYFPKTIKKSFGAIDLWNCRKQRRFSGISIR